MAISLPLALPCTLVQKRQKVARHVQRQYTRGDHSGAGRRQALASCDAATGSTSHPQAGLVGVEEVVVRGAAGCAAQDGLYGRIDVQLRGNLHQQKRF